MLSRFPRKNSRLVAWLLATALIVTSFGGMTVFAETIPDTDTVPASEITFDTELSGIEEIPVAGTETRAETEAVKAMGVTPTASLSGNFFTDFNDAASAGTWLQTKSGTGNAFSGASLVEGTQYTGGKALRLTGMSQNYPVYNTDWPSAKAFTYTARMRSTSTSSNNVTLSLMYRTQDKSNTTEPKGSLWGSLILKGAQTSGSGITNGAFLERDGSWPELPSAFETKPLVKDEWYVLSMSLSDDNLLSVYLDGVLIGTEQYTSSSFFNAINHEGFFGFRSWGTTQTYEIDWVSIGGYSTDTTSKATISAHPANVRINDNVKNAVFEVTASPSEGGVLSYRWQISGDGGKTWADIPGATLSEYTVPDENLQDGDMYRCAVINTASNARTTVANSDAAKLSLPYDRSNLVNIAPYAIASANDEYDVYTAASATNGSYAANSFWAAARKATADNPLTLTLTFDSPKTVIGAGLIQYNWPNALRIFEIQYLGENNVWQTFFTYNQDEGDTEIPFVMAGVAPTKDNLYYCDFDDQVTAEQFRLYITKTGSNALGLASFELYQESGEQPAPDSFDPEDLDTITSGDMTVTLYKKFPGVTKYETNGKSMDGLRKPVNTVSIGLMNADLGTNPQNLFSNYIPRLVEYDKTGADNATYKLYIGNNEGTGSAADDIFIITVNYKVEGTALIIDTLKIEEPKTGVKLKSIAYPDNAYASLGVPDLDFAQLAMQWTPRGDHTDTPPTAAMDSTSSGAPNSPNREDNWNKQYDRILNLKTGTNDTSMLLPRANKTVPYAYQPAAATGTPMTEAEANGRQVSMIFLSNGDLSATVANNRSSESERMWYTTNRAGDNYTSAEIGDARHYYRHEAALSTRQALGTINEKLLQDELPLTKIFITEDANDDSVADWQDGAIAYRRALQNEKNSTEAGHRNMTHMPLHNEYIRNSVGWINMSINSNGSTYYRIPDIIKRVYNFTDGFGQRSMFKGYQAQGHDDSNSDYGSHFSKQAGGLEGFNKMLEIGLKYNALMGVHVNATHPAADAYATDYRTNNGNASRYTWVDPMTQMHYERDMLSGQLYARFKELSVKAPNLRWIYIDVYGQSDWVGRHTMQTFEEADWMIMTEFGGPMQSYIAGTHWGSDIGYPGQTGSYSNAGEISFIKRFIYNDSMDASDPDQLIRGSIFLDLGAWRGHNFYSSASIFNAIDLPTKYMQHFELMNYKTGSEAVFTNGVKAVKEGDRTIIYGMGGKKIADLPYTLTANPSRYREQLDKVQVFIPWTGEIDIEDGLWDENTEFDKAYAYYQETGTATWDVPDSWTGGKATLYKLTEQGREKVQDVAITDGKITLTLQAATGYVVYPAEPTIEAAADWGEGTEISSMAAFPDSTFDSMTFDFWKKSSTGANSDHISYIRDKVGVNHLFVSGNSPDATVSQGLEVEPGENYTASIWVRIGGNDNNSARKTKLIIEDSSGNVLAENFVTRNTQALYVNEHPYASSYVYRTFVNHGSDGNGNPSFSTDRQWIHPLKVQFKAPADGKVTYKLYTEATGNANATVMFNWATCKKYLTDIDYEVNDPKVPFRENFENVDERWGGLTYGTSSQDSQTHLADKVDSGQEWYIPEGEDNKMGLEFNMPSHGLQPFSYVINGNYTLLTHESGTGEMLRTMPQALRLEANKKYKLSFNYKVYHETTANATGAYYAVAVRGGKAGGSYTDLFRENLASTPKAYTYSQPGYGVLANEPAPMKFEYEFETDGYESKDDPNDGDIYLVFQKLASGYITLFLDDIIIEEVKTATDVTGVSLDKDKLELTVGDTAALTATVEPEDATNKNVVWATGDKDVATVDSDGNVTAVAPGTATITVITEDGEFTAVCKVTVKAKFVPVTSVKIDGAAIQQVRMRNTKQFTATVNPSDATDKSLIWASSNEKIFTVDKNGLVTGLSTGNAKLIVTASDGVTSFIMVQITA